MDAAAHKHDLIITRSFDASVERLWQAWTDVALLQQWWGPEGFTCPLARLDVREGGTSLVAMHSPDHGTHYSTWLYQQVMPYERLEFVHNLADADGNNIDPVALGMPPEFPQNQRQTVVFNVVSADRAELIVTEYGWTPGQMMEFSRLGMTQCLTKLAALLARS